MDEFSTNYQNLAKEVYDETGVYLSAVINETRTVYHADWGCPRTGEPTFTLQGFLDKNYADKTDWKKAVVLLTKKIKDFYKQSTVRVIVRDVDVYLYSLQPVD